MQNEICHQFKIKLEHLENDLKEFNLNKEDLNNIRLSDLEFKHIPRSQKNDSKKVEKFIRKYEWLGTTTRYITNYFVLKYAGKIVCVVGFGLPSSFSKTCGEDTWKLEQCIHRGASSSIAPKNSASFLISLAMRWYVENTQYRLFTGYSTVDGANELGIIYQALNGILVSKSAGRRMEYLKPGTENVWLSDRILRKITNYRRIATKLGYEWQSNWSDRWKILWDNIPNDVEHEIRKELKKDIKNLKFRKVAPKLKYLIIKGSNKREKKQLIELFKTHNPNLINEDGSLGHKYPKRKNIKENEGLHN